MINTSLKYIINELSKQYNIPIYLCNTKDNFKIVEKTGNRNSKYIKKIFQLANEKHQEVDYFICKDELYATFNYKTNYNDPFKILIGPCPLPNLLTDSNDKSIHHLSLNYVSIRQHFISFVSVIYSLLKQQNLPMPPEWVSSKLTIVEIHKITGKNIQARRFNDANMDSIEFEKRFLDAIKRNHKDKVEWMINKVKEIYAGNISNDKLVSTKYKCVAIITLITRLSINSDVPAIQAYSLSDSLLVRLEKINSLHQCIDFIKEGSFMFMELIHSYPYKEKSELVKKVISYIDNNIYNKISIDTLSQYTNRHKTYIISSFKKEMNQTIHTYINKKKLSEAKYLLLLTDQNCKDIASLLNYSSQSHFIQVFKKQEGVTPNDYRLKNGLKISSIES